MNKTFKLEIKEFGEQGSFTGMASVYGNKDLGGDVVEPGAFSKSLSEKGGEVPILWQHDPHEPIGIGKIADSSDGLHIKGSLAIESSPTALKAYGLLKRGILKGLSIGYDTVRSDVKDTTRYLKELKLWEVSIVTFPMNEMALVQGIKAGDMTIEEMHQMLGRMRQTLEGMMAKPPKSLQAPSEHHAAVVEAPDERSAAMHDNDAPEILHPSLERISQLLRG